MKVIHPEEPVGEEVVLGRRSSAALRLSIVLVAALVHIHNFFPLYSLVGPVAAALSIVPVAIAGLLFGLRGGISAGLLVIPLNVILFSYTPQHDLSFHIRSIPAQIVTLAVGILTGWLKKNLDQLRKRSGVMMREDEALKKEIAEKEAIHRALYSEIAEHDRVEDSLRKNQQRTRLILDTAIDAFIAVDAEGKIVDWNAQSETLFGWTRKEALGRDLLDTVSPAAQREAYRSWLHDVRERTEEKTPVGLKEMVACHRDGGDLSVELAAAPVRWEDAVIVAIFLRDISVRKQTEESLLQSEKRYRQLLEVSPDAIVVTVGDEIAFANTAAQRLFGAMILKQLAARPFLDLVHPDCRDLVQQRVEQGLNEKEAPSLLEVKLLRLDGSPIDVEITSSTFDYSGKPASQVVIRDVRKRKQAERENRLLAQTVACAKDCFFITDLQGDILFVNDALVRAFGYGRSELLGKKISTLISAANVYDVSEEILSSTSAGGWYGEVFAVTSNKSTRPVELWTSVVKDDHGAPIAIVGVARDITDRKRADVALRRSEEQYRALVENLGDLIFTLDPQGRFRYVSPAIKQIAGYDASELIGEPFTRIAHPDEIDMLVSGFMETMAREQQQLEFRVLDKGGRIRNVRTSTQPALENGELIAVSGILADITDIKARLRAEEQAHLLGIQARELQSAREAAVRASELKSEFMANMSHEIRTPLTAILGASDMLRGTMLVPRQQNYVDLIVKGADALLSIVNEVLDFSKIEAGKIVLESLTFAPRDVLAQALQMLARDAARKNVTLGCQVSDDIPESLAGDPSRLRQVLLNLIGNGVKFTEKGEVTVRVKLVRDEPPRATLRFEVTDTGIGIPKETQSRLFQPFVQADGSTTRKHGGTGLGLSISRRIIDLMGGTISFESEPGKGSTFWFEVTLDRATGSIVGRGNVQGIDPLQMLPGRDPSVSEEEGEPFQEVEVVGEEINLHPHVLVVEDMEANQFVLTDMLRELGCRVDLATNGREAIEVVKEHRYDLVLMDCHLPEIDGWEATFQIRELEKGGRNSIIIAITADALERDKERCFAAGMDDYLSKPFKFVDLQRVIAKWITRPQRRPPGPPSPVGSPIDARILDAARIQELRSVGGDKDSSVLCRALDSYLKNTPKLIEQLQKAADVSNWQMISDINHSIGGTSANVGAVRLVELCSELSAGARKKEPQDAKAVINRMKNEFQRASVLLKKEMQSTGPSPDHL